MESKLKRGINQNNNLVKRQSLDAPLIKDKLLDEESIVKEVKKTLAQFTEKHKHEFIDIKRRDIFIVILIFMWILIVVIFAISISTKYTPLRFAY